MTPPQGTATGNHERQRSRASSPRSAIAGGRSKDGPVSDVKSNGMGHTSGVRPRKSVDELGKLPEKPALITSLSKGTLASNGFGERTPSGTDISPHAQRKRAKLRSPWSCSMLTFFATLLAGVLAALIARSFLTRQLDPKGAAMSYMRPAFVKFPEFDTEHTRFASKYSLYLYREGGIDEDTTVGWIHVCALCIALTAHRSKVFQRFSYLEMQEAISKFDRLLLKPPYTSMSNYNQTRQLLRQESVPLISLVLISTKTLQPFMDRHFSIKLNISTRQWRTSCRFTTIRTGHRETPTFLILRP